MTTNKNTTPLDQETLHFDQDFTEKTTSPNDEDTLLICDHDDLLETKVIKVSNFLTKGDTKVIYGKLENSKDNQILAYKEGNIANVEINNLVNALDEKTVSPNDNDTLLICDNKDLKPKKIKASTLLTKGDTAVVYAKLQDIKDTQILSYKDGNITNVNIKDLVNFSGFVLKHSVDTIADLAKDFPNPKLGWASLVKKEDMVHYPAGVLYIYTTKEDESGNDWIKFDMMSAPNIVEDLDMNNFDLKNLNHLKLNEKNQPAADIYVEDKGIHFNTTDGKPTDIHCNSLIAQDYSPILERCYPIGSLYINTSNSTNPKELLGFGTWEAFGGSRVPIGVNSNDNLFNTGEKTGGNADTIVPRHNHGATSTVNDPGHNHDFANTWLDGTRLYHEYCKSIALGDDGSNFNYNGKDRDGKHRIIKANTGVTVSTEIDTVGENPKNTNLQPYITVYMWKRTS